MAFRPHRFGRYIIVDPIAVGGMAEIYRARVAASKEGPDRVIVIKKVIANLSQNSEFIQMFEEEIKITVGLTHPNIIQIYDYGKNDDQYFMAMEYVEGKNLRQFVKRLADMKSMFSIDMSCYIISQVCHALAYAHGFKDRMSGRALGIVHRDISPQNVMISYDGAVKLFDFGIAKAKSASESTRAGVIKGKPSYLSPEQINGEELDGRCDIFALGIVLWELLTAKRLFVAETDMGVLRLIQNAKIEPPSTFNPAVPQSLDAIVLKSLTRDKNKRYQGAEEFQRDLHKFLYSFNPSFNPADLSYYAQELFKNEIHEDRERLQKFLAMDPVDEQGLEPRGKGSSPKLSNKLPDGLISTTDFNREMMEMTVKDKTGSFNKAPELELADKPSLPSGLGSSGSSRPLNPGGTQSRPLTGGSLPPPRRHGPNDNMVIPPWSRASGSAMTPRPGMRVNTQATPRQDILGADDGARSSGRNMLALVAIVLVGLVFVARQGGMLCGTPLEMLDDGCARGPASKTPVVPESTAPKPSAEGEQPASPKPAVAQAAILIRTQMRDYQVKVNGRPALVSNGQFNVPLREKLVVEVTSTGFQKQGFVVPPLEKATTYAYDVPAVAVPMGVLAFNTLPSSSVVLYLNGEKVFSGRTPIRDNFPVGRYRAHFENSLLGIKGDTEIVVEQGKVVTVEKNLEMKR